MAWFGFLGHARRQKEEHPLIVDVQQVIADSVWDRFLNTLGWWQRLFLRREKFSIEVPMNFYCFEQEGSQVFETKKRLSGAVSAGAEPSTSQSGLEGQQLARRDQTSPEHIGLDTIFNNYTDMNQTYNFTFEKTRRASVTVSYQRGYSIGGSANFTLELPKKLSDGTPGLGMNMSIQVKKGTGETFEENITTSANSQITVKDKSRCTVSVTMEERSLLANFKLTMIMSMLDERAPVYIRNKASGDLVCVGSVENLLQIFGDQENVDPVKDADGTVRDDAVKFHIKGVVDGMLKSSHVINLKGRPLQSDNEEAEGGTD